MENDNRRISLTYIPFLLFSISLLFVPEILRAKQVDSVKVKSIAEIRSSVSETDKILGDTVKVSARASVGSSVINTQNITFFLQDQQTGIGVLVPQNLQDVPPVTAGDSVIVTGIVNDFENNAHLVAISYRIIGVPRLIPEPIPLAAAMVNPENHLGMLVDGEAYVTGKTIGNNYKRLTVSSSESSKHSINVFIPPNHSLKEEFNFQIINQGDRVHISGIVDKHVFEESGDVIYQILPRTGQDIEFSTLPQRYLIIGLIVAIILITAILVWILTLKKKIRERTRNLTEAVEEKEVLLQEIHHRVKNNLSIISGLIELQLDTTEDEQAKNVLEDSQSRIQSMAMIHDKLYKTDTLSSIRLDNYIEELTETIARTFQNVNDSVSVEYDLDPIEMDIDKTVACGLLVNELVVNAFKHAFKPGNDGKLEITLKRENGKAELIIADNGPGLPDNFKESVDGSLGTMLIDTFSQQLGAQTELLKNYNGAAFRFQFPIEE